MSEQHSVTVWIKQLEQGDADAAAKLFRRYFADLVAVARRRLQGAPRRVADEDDVAARAFESFFQRAPNREFPDLCDRDGLWKLLVTIADRKAKNQTRDAKAAKRGGGRVVGESALAAANSSAALADFAACPAPTPELAAELTEQYERLMANLADDELRLIAQLRCEGFTNFEIAKRIDRSVPTVERRLKRIRSLWQKELES